MTTTTQRADAIAAYGAFDRPPDRDLEMIVELAAQVAGTPIAMVNLISETSRDCIAAIGVSLDSSDLEDSLCARVVDEPNAVVVPDISNDRRFDNHPLLGLVKFYASHQLRSSTGQVIGRLCVSDFESRTIDEEQVVALGKLADRVMHVLELAMRSNQLARSLTEVEQMRDALAASNERLEALAGQLAHDLKAPLGSLTMALGLVLEQVDDHGDLPANSQFLLDRAVRGANQMADLIDRVLGYARLDAALRHERVAMRALVDDVLHNLEDQLHGAIVDVGDLPVVFGDEAQLRAVLQNLLANAAKFRSPDRDLMIDIRSRRRGTNWLFTITDNGRGISRADSERLFERSVQADDSVEGFGIGLDTCRRIIVAHSGVIGLDPARGHGTTAWFALPA